MSNTVPSIAPVARRSALLLAGAGALAWLTSARRAPPITLGRGAKDELATPLELAQFLELGNALAKRLVKDGSALGQDRYLHALAALAVRLSDVPVPEMKAQSTPGHEIGFNPGGETFTVLHWRLAPGAEIRDHVHAYGNVVTLLLDGDVRIRNHEIVGDRDGGARGPFRVRRTCEAFLRPGGINLVSLERDSIHGFRAGPKGARGLDITTRIRERTPTPDLQIAAEPIDAASALYEAKWADGG